MVINFCVFIKILKYHVTRDCMLRIRLVLNVLDPERKKSDFHHNIKIVWYKMI